MKKKSKVSLLSVLVVFAFTLSGCFINDTEWPGFSVGGDSDIVTEPGPVEEPEHTHTYGDWQYDETYHWKVCSECGEIGEKAEHTLEYTDNEDGETHDATCTICEYHISEESHNLSYVSVDNTYHHEACSKCSYATSEAAHEFTVVVTNPTCTEGGYTTHTCGVCNYSYIDNVTNALGHNWSDWTDDNDDDVYHTRTCNQCNKTETEEHDYELTNISDINVPDATALYEYTCSVCSHVLEKTEEYVFDFATDSWEIINEVSTQGYASIYYNVGDTKTITIGSETHDVRIIDFDHDRLSPDDGGDEGNGGGDDDDDNDERKTAGMTIEMVDCLSTEYQLNSDSTYTSWENCSLKTALDEEIFSSLPEELQGVIKGVQKKTNNGASNATVSSSENNKLFLPAIAELYSEDGIKNTADNSSDLSQSYHQGIYLQEGKQYAYYAELIGDQDPKANCEKLKKIVPGKTDGDVEKGYWVRSPNSNSANYVWRFGWGEEHEYCMYNDAGPNVERGVSFMFCV